MKSSRFASLAIVVVLLLFCSLVVAAAADSPTSNLSGSASIQYRYRSDGDNTDQDAMQFLSFDYFRSWSLFGPGAEVGFVFYGSAQEDLDDHPQETEGDDGDAEEGEGVNYDPFRELSDSYDNSTAFYLYLAYLEVNGYSTLNKLRLGRQESYDLDPVAFDGGLITLRASKFLYVTAFGGVPVNQFEEGNRSGDSVAGGYLDIRPIRSLSLIAGYMNLRDEVELLDGTNKTLDNDLIYGQLSWRFDVGGNFLAKAVVQDSELRDVTTRLSHYSEKLDMRVSAFYFRSFIERKIEPLNSDPFSILLGSLEPYHQGGANIYKGIGKYVGIEGGAMFRELLDYNDETSYNHSYDRYMLSLYLYKFPFASSQWVLGGDTWSASGDAYNQSYRGEYSQKIMKSGKVYAGTSYYLFKVNEITGYEDEDVRVYYVGAKIPVIKNTAVTIDYSFEDGSLRELDTLKAGLSYEF